MDGTDLNRQGGHGGGHAATESGGHISLQAYMIGFTLSVILTAAAFGLVMAGMMPASAAIPVVFALAAVQMAVHVVCFLHLTPSSARSWNGLAFAFTIVVVAILVGGSLWVMYHLDENMMPGMMPPGMSPD